MRILGDGEASTETAPEKLMGHLMSDSSQIKELKEEAALEQILRKSESGRALLKEHQEVLVDATKVNA